MCSNDDEKKCLYEMGLLWNINIKNNTSNLFRKFMYNRNKPLNESFLLCETIEGISTVISGCLLTAIYLFYSFLILFIYPIYVNSIFNSIGLCFAVLLFFTISCLMIIHTFKAVKILTFIYIN
ncbi:membrane protein [Candidatus Magnetomorum sp. HK-1]|nr:membrane protein [Candidatus Magnetomorum sp. HK-1]